MPSTVTMTRINVCGNVSPEQTEPMTGSWTCTAAPGHTGDHTFVLATRGTKLALQYSWPNTPVVASVKK